MPISMPSGDLSLTVLKRIWLIRRFLPGRHLRLYAMILRFLPVTGIRQILSLADIQKLEGGPNLSGYSEKLNKLIAKAEMVTRKDRQGKERIVSKYPHDRNWTSSYRNLREYAFFWDNRVFTSPRTMPGKFGAMESKLYKMLKKGHHGVKLSDEQMHRLVLWLDSNSDFYGSYENTERQAAGEVVLPTME